MSLTGFQLARAERGAEPCARTYSLRNSMVRGSDGYPLPSAAPMRRSRSRSRSRSTLATTEAAATAVKRESARWYESTRLPESCETRLPNRAALTSHEST